MLEIQMEEVKTKVLIPEYIKEIVAPQMPLYYDKMDLATNPMCKCPFHDDNTPSMRYYAETNTFSCLGCGAGGDITDLDMKFIQKLTGEIITLEESVEFLHAKFLSERED